MTPDVEAKLSALANERRKAREAREARRKRAALQARRRVAEMRSLRIPLGVHVELVAAARRGGVSVNSLIVAAIRAKLGLVDVDREAGR